MLLWGVDLGGTKVELAVVRPERPFTPLYRNRLPTERQRGYEHIVDRVRELVELGAAELDARPHTIGVGHPGSEAQDTGVLKNSNTTALNGKPLRRDLERAIGVPLVMANDANCFALAESRSPNIPAARVAFGVILGTGVGGGLVIDGRAWNGRQGLAGEWGHNVLDPDGTPCYCGRRGCVETVISGPALERWYEGLTGERRPLDQIAVLASQGEDAAVETLDRLVTSFGRAIASVVNIVDPDVIILGGGVSNIGALYDRARDVVREHVFNPTFDTPILKHSLGDSAGVFGAALLTAEGSLSGPATGSEGE